MVGSNNSVKLEKNVIIVVMKTHFYLRKRLREKTMPANYNVFVNTLPEPIKYA